MKTRIRYLKKDSIIILPKHCVGCGRKSGYFSRHWELVEVITKLPYIPSLLFLNRFPFAKRKSEFLCRKCAPEKHQFVVFFSTRMLQKSTAIQQGLANSLSKTNKTIKRKLAKDRHRRTTLGSKCACGSGKKYKNCCKKKYNL